MLLMATSMQDMAWPGLKHQGKATCRRLGSGWMMLVKVPSGARFMHGTVSTVHALTPSNASVLIVHTPQFQQQQASKEHYYCC